MPDGAAWPLFLQSLLIGLSIAAPVGPIGLLTIQRTLALGPAAGLATGLGAAAADAAYGPLGAFGVTALINALTAARAPLALAGGGFMLWMAWSTWQARVDAPAAQAGSAASLLRCFGGTFVLTLIRPSLAAAGEPGIGAAAGRVCAVAVAGAAAAPARARFVGCRRRSSASPAVHPPLPALRRKCVAPGGPAAYSPTIAKRHAASRSPT